MQNHSEAVYQRAEQIYNEELETIDRIIESEGLENNQLTKVIIACTVLLKNTSLNKAILELTEKH